VAYVNVVQKAAVKSMENIGPKHYKVPAGHISVTSAR
jgi:hypothetical protein